ncbi:MAG TPA: class I SAM-dependent methyltransferase, partial [Bacteroidota bacterium]
MAEQASHLSSRSAASDVFDALAATYDAQEFENPVFRWMRRRVWDRCLANFQPGSEILELNCGTGIDAAFLANQGFRVVATDVSDEMLSSARRKIESLNGSALVRVRKLDFRDLSSLSGSSFDGALSNFGGLNCVEDLQGVASDLASLLKPGAVFVACVMPKLALWELAFGLLRADRKLLTRRLRKRRATVRGKQLTV